MSTHYKIHLASNPNDFRNYSTIDHIENEIGPIDILINNAGIIKRIPLKDMEAEDYREVIDVDLVGPFIMAKQVVNYMIPRNAGKIINICSMMSESLQQSEGLQIMNYTNLIFKFTQQSK